LGAADTDPPFMNRGLESATPGIKQNTHVLGIAIGF